MARKRRQSGSPIEKEIVRQTRQAFRIKDDWPQSLIMSMGVVFLLSGLGLRIARHVPNRPGAPKGIVQTMTTSRPHGRTFLALGALLAMLGYCVPMKRAT